MSRNFPQGDWTWDMTVPPSAEPITLAQAKSHLRIEQDLTDFDTEITEAIQDARAYLEDGWGLKIMPQKWTMTLQQFPRADTIRLEYGPVKSVDTFTFTDTTGADFSLIEGTDFLTRLAKKPVEIILPFGKIWPATILQTADGVQLGLTMGFAVNDSPSLKPLPPQLRRALYLLLGHFYENRSAVTVGTLNVSTNIETGVASMMSTLGYNRY